MVVFASRALPRVPLDILPCLPVHCSELLNFLPSVVGTGFSRPEWRAHSQLTATSAAPSARGARLGLLKTSLHTIAAQFVGHSMNGSLPVRTTPWVFFTDNKDGTPRFLMYVSAVRATTDAPNAVLDAMVMVLDSDVSDLARGEDNPEVWAVQKLLHARQHKNAAGFTGGLHTVHVNCDDDELVCWRYLLCAAVESGRCGWSHSAASCDYLLKRSMPVSLDWTQPCLCRCGAGQRPPESFMAELATFPEAVGCMLRPLFTRAAIPLVLPPPSHVPTNGQLLVESKLAPAQRPAAQRARRSVTPGGTSAITPEGIRNALASMPGATPQDVDAMEADFNRRVAAARAAGRTGTDKECEAILEAVIAPLAARHMSAGAPTPPSPASATGSGTSGARAPALPDGASASASASASAGVCGHCAATQPRVDATSASGGATTGRMLLCGRCKAARYCCRACQKADWKAHKKGCGK